MNNQGNSATNCTQVVTTGTVTWYPQWYSNCWCGHCTHQDTELRERIAHLEGQIEVLTKLMQKRRQA
jgi:hypothetical protein